MVPSPAGSTEKPRLSYAERAKKAQSVKPSAPTPVSRNPQQTSSTTVSALNSPSTNGNAPSLTAPSKSTTIIATAAPEPTQAVLLNSPSTPPVLQPTNGNTAIPKDIATKPSVAGPEQNTAPKVPPVNVWHRRQEERAARALATQTTASPPAQTRTPTTPSVSHDSTSLSQTEIKDSKSALIDPPSKPIPPTSIPNETLRPILPQNQNPVVTPPTRTPTTSHHQPSTLIPSIPSNSDDWPTVQAAAQAVPSTTTPLSINSTLPEPSQPEAEQLVGIKRSEKPKWVQIPPEELQATADANRNTGRQHSRRGTHHGYQHNPSRINHPNSRAPSRNHSGRNSVSHSVVQSRVQSRSASAQSSPNLPRTKRLPGDDLAAPLVGGQTSHRSSGRNSPHIHSHLHRGPLVAGDQGIAGNLPVYSVSAVPALNGTTYYNQPPPLHPPLLLPDQFSHSPHSPLHPPIPVYASGSASPSQQYHGVVPYPVYPPYMPYEYPHQRYSPWTGSIEGSPDGHYSHNAHLPYPVPQPLQVQHSIANSGVQANEQIPVLSIQSTPAAVRSDDAPTGEKFDQPVLFGTIEVPDLSSKSPSPTPQISRSESTGSDTETIRKMFTGFSVGVGPDETTPRKARHRSSKPKINQASTTSNSSDAGTPESSAKPNSGEPLEAPAKWEFGSTGQLTTSSSKSTGNKNVAEDEGTSADPIGALPISLHGLPVEPPQLPPLAFGHIPSPPGPLHPPPPHMHMIHGPTPPHPGYVMPPAPYFDPSHAGDEWPPYAYNYPTNAPASHLPPPLPPIQSYQVPASGSPVVSKSDSVRSDNDDADDGSAMVKSATERREDKPREDVTIGGARGRRGYGYDRNYGGRRGRGTAGRGYSRGYQRGGGNFQHLAGPSGHQSQVQQRQPYSGTPPPMFQSLVVGEPTGPYFPPPRQSMSGYMNMGYEGFPPMPPIIPPGAPYPPPTPAAPSPVSYGPQNNFANTLLLKQLEYYLSPQNLAQDLFLRRRMDARGWISISLIASFNRVKQFTHDAQLVREVFMTSSQVEVRGDWVRMIGWEKFVLPDAQPSTVEPEISQNDASVVTGISAIGFGEIQSHGTTGPHAGATTGLAVGGDNVGENTSSFDPPGQGQAANGREGSDCEDDDDDEDVEIVMGKETGLWTGGGGNKSTTLT